MKISFDNQLNPFFSFAWSFINWAVLFNVSSDSLDWNIILNFFSLVWDISRISLIISSENSLLLNTGISKFSLKFLRAYGKAIALSTKLIFPFKGALSSWETEASNWFFLEMFVPDWDWPETFRLSSISDFLKVPENCEKNLYALPSALELSSF